MTGRSSVQTGLVVFLRPERTHTPQASPTNGPKNAPASAALPNVRCKESVSRPRPPRFRSQNRKGSRSRSEHTLLLRDA